MDVPDAYGRGPVRVDVKERWATVAAQRRERLLAGWRREHQNTTLDRRSKLRKAKLSSVGKLSSSLAVTKTGDVRTLTTA